MKKTLIGALLRIIQRHSDSPIVSGIRKVAQAIIRAAYNASYQFETNGENRVARIILRNAPAATVIDVGANVGDWSLSIVPHLGAQSLIHAFEPVPDVFGKLMSKTSHCSSIHHHNLGLSRETGPLTFLYSEKTSQKSSLESASATSLNTKVKDYRALTLQFLKGDEFAQSNGLSRIRFIKIDTEGHDFHVLEGFKAMIERGEIDAIQFEYNALNIYTRNLLLGFYELLSPEGGRARYVIGRIFPRSVRFKPYEVQDENFIDGNFLAVRSDLTELIASLQAQRS